MKKFLTILLALSVTALTAAFIAGCGNKCTHPTDAMTLISTTATCTASGTETWKCRVCGETIEKNVEAYGHIYSESVNKEIAGWGGTDTNRKCKYCDLVQCNGNLVKPAPETITVYQHMEGTNNLKKSEMTVNDVKFFCSAGNFYMAVTATPTFVYDSDPHSPSRALFIAAKITDSNGNTVDGEDEISLVGVRNASSNETSSLVGKPATFYFAVAENVSDNTTSVTYNYEILEEVIFDKVSSLNGAAFVYCTHK